MNNAQLNKIVTEGYMNLIADKLTNTGRSEAFALVVTGELFAAHIIGLKEDMMKIKITTEEIESIIPAPIWARLSDNKKHMIRSAVVRQVKDIVSSYAKQEKRIRQFVDSLENEPFSKETEEMIDRLKDEVSEIIYKRMEAARSPQKVA